MKVSVNFFCFRGEKKVSSHAQKQALGTSKGFFSEFPTTTPYLVRGSPPLPPGRGVTTNVSPSNRNCKLLFLVHAQWNRGSQRR